MSIAPKRESSSRPKGELGELKNALVSYIGRTGREHDSAKRDLFKKVINFMTIGMDMSSLFTQMIMAATGEDLVLKKMLYLYISTYAQQKADLILLTVNTLQKDCMGDDPTVRGLALRSLCSLRVPNLLEYLMEPVKRGLKDHHPYVRRTAVMGVLKIYHMDAQVVLENQLPEALSRGMMEDPDPTVVSNCLHVLRQMPPHAPPADRTHVYRLLNMIKEFNEWGQCESLDFVSNYRPQGEDEVFDILNVLEPLMQQSNSAVVLGSVKLFLLFTLNMPATHQQVLERVQAPLLTLIGSGSPEAAYVLLSHLRLMVERAPVLFAQDYKHFYCRYTDPLYVKEAKLEILKAMADTTNAYDIVTELSEYVSDIEAALSRLAVRAVGSIALNTPDTPGLIERLLGFLELGREHVTAETIVQVRDIVRRFPESADVCLSYVTQIPLHAVAEPLARAAYIFMLGELGDKVDDAPYALEEVAGAFTEEDVKVRRELIAAAAKLFLHRPPEAKRLLGAVLAQGARDSDPDVRDRAVFYYRLFRGGIDKARAALLPPGGHSVPTSFLEGLGSEAKEQVFSEFNTLSVVYRVPAVTFVDEENLTKQVASEDLMGPTGAPTGAPVQADLLDLEAGSNELLSESDRTDVPGLLDDTSAAAPGAPGPSGGGALLDLAAVLTPAGPAAPPAAAPTGLESLGSLSLGGGIGIGGGMAAAPAPAPASLGGRQPLPASAFSAGPRPPSPVQAFQPPPPLLEATPPPLSFATSGPPQQPLQQQPSSSSVAFPPSAASNMTSVSSGPMGAAGAPGQGSKLGAFMSRLSDKLSEKVAEKLRPGAMGHPGAPGPSGPGLTSPGTRPIPDPLGPSNLPQTVPGPHGPNPYTASIAGPPPVPNSTHIFGQGQGIPVPPHAPHAPPLPYPAFGPPPGAAPPQPQPPPQPPMPVVQAAQSPAAGLQGFSLGGGDSDPFAGMQTVQHLHLAPPSTLSMSPQRFQQLWTGTQAAAPPSDIRLTPRVVGTMDSGQAQQIITFFQARNIATMAWGGQSPSFKFYLYASPAGRPGCTLLAEVLATTSQQRATLTVKADGAGAAEVLEPFKAILEASWMAFDGHAAGQGSGAGLTVI